MYLQVEVLDESNSVLYTTTSPTLSTLSPDATATFDATGTYVASSPGQLKFHYRIFTDQTDEQPADDTLSSYVQITSTEYARDNGSLVGNLGIGAGNGHLGQEFAITADATLASISIFAAAPQFGPYHIGADVFRVVNGVPEYVPLYDAPPITIPVDSQGQWHEFMIPGGLDLLAGDTIMIAAEEMDSTMQIGQASGIFTPGTVWVKWSGNPNWNNIETFGPGFAKTFMIRAELITGTCSDGILNQNEEGIDCGGICDPCTPPDAKCGIITVYVNPSAPVYDGPGSNNIWWIPSAQLDAGSSSAYLSPNLDVRRHLSTLTFDWTTNGACIDATPNGGPLSNPDKGTAYRDCLPVRNADFNVWKLYQLRIQDPAGTDECHGQFRVVPQSAGAETLKPVIHYAIPDEEYIASPDPDAPTLIEEMIVVPNPGSDVMHILWSALQSESVVVRITDTNGRVISAQRIESVGGRNELIFPMDAYSPGMYVVSLSSGQNHLTQKWIKAH